MKKSAPPGYRKTYIGQTSIGLLTGFPHPLTTVDHIQSFLALYPFSRLRATISR